FLAQASVSLVSASVLCLGVTTACTAAQWDRGDWLAYHVLTLSWALAGLLALAIGRIRVPRTIESEIPQVPLAVRAWVTLIGAMVSALALRGAVADTGSAWWSAGPILAVSVMAGLLALWQRREAGVFVAALGVNFAVSM